MSSQLTVAVIGAAGKMGLRVSDNLEKSSYRVLYSENAPAGIELLKTKSRSNVDSAEAALESDVVLLAVPDLALGKVSEALVPLMKPGSILLTLDPAAAYAGLIARRDDVALAVAHPCHPSVFLQRTTREEYADTFGGVAAPQEVVAAIEANDPAKEAEAEGVIRTIYGPVIDVHWVTVKQLAQLEPTLVETVTCMVSTLLRDALDETVNRLGVPEAAARAILLGHTQIALTNSLRSSNPFSDACLIAMDYGRKAIVRDDWKKVFEDEELDKVIATMLHIRAVKH